MAEKSVQSHVQHETTITVDKLYGVSHGGQMEIPFVGQIRLGLRPSVEMLSELSNLPKGTKVGIEALDKKGETDLRLLIRNHGQGYDEWGTHRYWNELIKFLEKHELTPVYLDDTATYKKQVRLCSSMNELIAKRDDSENPSEQIKFQRQIYAKQTEIQFDLAFARHEFLLQRIVETKPQVLIIGNGHAAPLWYNSKNGILKGIKFKDYSSESMPDFSNLEDMLSLQMGVLLLDSDRYDLEMSINNRISANVFVKTPTDRRNIVSLHGIRCKEI